MAKPLESGKWASTADVAAAARVTTVTALDWAKRGVLPAYTVVYAGRRGRAARWPLHAPAQAVWVRERLDAGLTFAEIAELLNKGGFSGNDV